MKFHMCRSYSFPTALLLLAAVLATARLSYALPQSSQSASASASTLRSLAEQGNADAQYNLAQSYLRHDPTNKDYQSALKWLRASVEQGNASAEFLLGYLYEHGEGVPHDYAKAVENYRAAALQGHSSAENNLASLYQHGQGVPKSTEQDVRMVSGFRATRKSCRPMQSGDALLPRLGDAPELQRSGPMVSRGSRFRIRRGSKQSGGFLLQRAGRRTRLQGSCTMASPSRATWPAQRGNKPSLPLRAGERPAARLCRCLCLVFQRARRG